MEFSFSKVGVCPCALSSEFDDPYSHHIEPNQVICFSMVGTLIVDVLLQDNYLSEPLQMSVSAENSMISKKTLVKIFLTKLLVIDAS